MPKILITGGNGFLGEHLIPLLKRLDNGDVIATARDGNRLKQREGYAYYSMDVCDKKQVEEVVAKVRPDYIVHAAAMTQVDRCEEEKKKCWEVNVTATQYLVEAARKVDAFFIFISTDFIFDGQSGPYEETSAAHPVNYYGESKWEAEKILQQSDLPYAILRTILVYGVSENSSRSNIVLWVKKSLEQRKEIRVVCDQWRTPTLVQDLAEGCKLVIEKKEANKEIAPVYNISGKQLLTPYQMALKIADYFGLDRQLITRADASTFQQKAKRPAKTGFIIERAETDLDYHPHTFEEGLGLLTGLIG